ncbi:MAG: enoyl-CoA hydratase/isomerase family protein [Sphingosinicella sp.]
MFLLEQKGAVTRLTLDRPQARNAIPVAGWRELARTVEELADSDMHVLVLNGAGEAFCAGADLSEFPYFRSDTEAVAEFREAMNEAFTALSACRAPTIAWVDGPCYGAGVALALACDIRIAGSGACFAITPAKLGIGYPQDDVHRLVELVGSGQAYRLLFTAATIDAAEAVRIGLAEMAGNEVSVEEMAGSIAALPPQSLHYLKRAVRMSLANQADPDLDDAFDRMLAEPEVTSRRQAMGRK